MSTIETTAVSDAAAQALSERLADVFRTLEVDDLLAEDVFLDGHPPFWRFQIEGRDQFATWLRAAMPTGAHIEVARTVPTATGFVTELVGRHDEDGAEKTDRKIALCEVRGTQVSSMTVYCSGDWDADLRARHAAETTLLRP